MIEKHSPLPWRNVGSGQAADANGMFAASTVISPNALSGAREAEDRLNLIVSAVNGLPEAIAALEAIIEDAPPRAPRSAEYRDDNGLEIESSYAKDVEHYRLAEIARAALAKVKDLRS